MIYLDSCALLKLAHAEAESDALRTWLVSQREDEVLVSSSLAEVETTRALRRGDPASLERLPTFFSSFDFFEIDRGIRQRAAAYPDPGLRSLDAIHLATAEELRTDLLAFVTYDKRLASAASGIGLPVVAPS